jgi:predicted transcriptional regulator
MAQHHFIDQLGLSPEARFGVLEATRENIDHAINVLIL